MITGIGKINGSVPGFKSGNIYSLSCGKPVEFIDGDLNEDYVILPAKEVETASMDMDKVETADAPKRTRTTKK
jgi:hypothetical protein